MTISILQAINSLPSNAIKAALDGIENQAKRSDYKTKMKTFGDYDADLDLCYGCAATAALQEIGGRNLDKFNIDTPLLRATALNMDLDELIKFEDAIDDARAGFVMALGIFCKVDVSAEEKEIKDYASMQVKPGIYQNNYECSMAVLNKVYTTLLAAGK